MSDGPLDDPYIAEEIRSALRPYEDRLSAEDLAWMRDQLLALLTSDPEARSLLARAHPRGQIDRSGERLRPGVTAPEGASGRDEETG